MPRGAITQYKIIQRYSTKTEFHTRGYDGALKTKT